MPAPARIFVSVMALAALTTNCKDTTRIEPPPLKEATVRFLSPDHPDATRHLKPITMTIGVWKARHNGVDIITSIHRTSSGYSMKQILGSYGTTVEPLTPIGGNRFHLSNNDYFVVKQGYLDAYDASGLIWSAPPLD